MLTLPLLLENISKFDNCISKTLKIYVTLAGIISASTTLTHRLDNRLITSSDSGGSNC